MTRCVVAVVVVTVMLTTVAVAVVVVTNLLALFAAVPLPVLATWKKSLMLQHLTPLFIMLQYKLK